MWHYPQTVTQILSFHETEESFSRQINSFSLNDLKATVCPCVTYYLVVCVHSQCLNKS